MLATFVAAVSALALLSGVKADNEVFAHLIIGNTASYSQDNFFSDIQAASAAGIDGFALNIAQDDYTQQSLNNVYAAAEQFGNGFSLFLSFDYAVVGHWDPNTVVSLINEYSGRSAQFKYNNQPVASTFEGPDYASDWANIKQQTGCFFIPDYSSKGASGAASQPNVDGLLSWDAWPNYQDNTPTTDPDYVSALGGRPYMMAVSPWFYADCYGKNWIWHADQLWPMRWQQVFQIKPTFVEILTWNDFGESHYIGPNAPDESDIPTGANRYVDNVPHNSWLKDLPYYISKYKSGGAEPAVGTYTPHITFWYRTNPIGSCDSGGATCNSAMNGQQTYAPTDCATDAIFFTVFTDQTATVDVSIGGYTAPSQSSSLAGIFTGSVPFNGATGTVTITATLADGSKLGPVTGADITTSCTDGIVNWNAWVGSS